MAGCCVHRWSLSLGRWWGVPVRLHIFLLFFIVLAAAFTLPADMGTAGLMMVAVLLASVVLHELGHALAALRVGGKVDTIVIGPVGGLVSPRVPDEPEMHLFVALAGPLMHLLLVVLAAAGLVIWSDADVVGLLHPLAPVQMLEGSWMLVTVQLAVWLNWVLLLANLLPAYPFDGGPILRAMLWPALGRRSARVATSRAAMTVAAMICVAALLTIGGDQTSPFPMWIPLVTLGIFLFFSAQQDLVSGDVYELFDDDAGYHTTNGSSDTLEAMWSDEEEEDAVLVEHQQERHEQYRRAQEAYEDARVDDILARLHDSGVEELSPEEYDVLRRAGERYKERQRDLDKP